MSCQQAMDLVAQIEDQLSVGNVLKRKLARSEWVLAFPEFAVFDEPDYYQEIHAHDTQVAVASIRPRAEILAAGDSDAVQDTSTVLQNGKEELYENEPQGFGQATLNAQNWWGACADDFKAYLAKTDTDYRIAQDACNDLKTLYDLYGSIVSECHDDLVSILQAGLKAFQSVGDAIGPIALSVAAGALSVLTSGDTLLLVTIGTASGVLSGLSAEVTVDSSSDLGTAQSIVDGLDTLKQNVMARMAPVTGAVEELQSKITNATLDVQDNLPMFMRPGQPFDPTTFQPDTPNNNPNAAPVSRTPLIPTPPTSTGVIASRLAASD